MNQDQQELYPIVSLGIGADYTGAMSHEGFDLSTRVAKLERRVWLLNGLCGLFALFVLVGWQDKKPETADVFRTRKLQVVGDDGVILAEISADSLSKGGAIHLFDKGGKMRAGWSVDLKGASLKMNYPDSKAPKENYILLGATSAGAFTNITAGNGANLYLGADEDGPIMTLVDEKGKTRFTAPLGAKKKG